MERLQEWRWQKRLWRKLRLKMDEETLEIRVVGVATSNDGPSRQNPAEATMPPDLLEQVPPIKSLPRSQIMRRITHADATM